MYKNFFKRIFDFCIALVALLCLSPILLVVTVWLLFANKGAGAKLTSSSQGCAKDKSVRARLAAWFAPVFFIQERPGLHGKIFKIVKFKTMTDERDANGKLLPSSERITPIGNFLRKSSIDELPQLFNVLKGDMSIIGPRPLMPRYLELYSTEQARRHDVRPGITGWAQVNGRNAISWTEKFRLDVWYVDHCSFMFDCKIIYKTILNVLKRKDIQYNGNSANSEGFNGHN